MTPLMKAIRSCRFDALCILDTPDLDVRERDNRGWTALHYAAQCGLWGTIEFLLERGADINARSGQGTTSLTIARVNNYRTTAEFLKSHGGIE
jgi:ankyrin repeat protein